MTGNERVLLSLKAQREGWNIPQSVAGNSILAANTQDKMQLTDEERETADDAMADIFMEDRWPTNASLITLRAITVSIAAHQRFHGLKA